MKIKLVKRQCITAGGIVESWAVFIDSIPYREMSREEAEAFVQGCYIGRYGDVRRN